MQFARNFLHNIRQLDAYPKTLEDFRIKTFSGATVTIVSCIIATILFFYELSYYLEPQIQQQVLVDVSKGERLKIHFDLIFPQVPCSALSVDAIDVSGNQQINIVHDIYKTRLDVHGEPIDNAKKDNSLNLIKSKQLQVTSTTVKPTLDPSRCESCYGAETSTRKCCNTCDAVKEAYHMKGWALSNLNSIEQCKREGLVNAVSNEGCKIFGFVEVARVGGNLHIAPGRSMDLDHRHVHDITNLDSFNTSHIINHLSFVTYEPGHLDGTTHTADSAMASFRYYIKVVNSIFVHLNGTTVPKSDFAVTIHKSTPNNDEASPAGVYFVYEFAPMMIRYTFYERPFLHFLTSVCAIIGGVFSLASLVDLLLYMSLRKTQIAKLS